MLENVVFVHGLWMMGVDMTLLRRRIRKQHFAVHQFSYPTLRRNSLENAVLLQKYLKNLDGQTVHIVAHSLGGLVVRHLFHLYPDQRYGRVVMLGTPHTGSVIARVLIRTAWGQLILGKSTDQGLLGGVPEWRAKNALGIIAGNKALGAGRLVYRFEGESDGTVAVAETHLDGIADHLILPTTHTGLIYNKEVAEQVCLFIKQGYFKHKFNTH
jgi:pimeloyl-ACP methyl ester carboxylesterase